MNLTDIEFIMIKLNIINFIIQIMNFIIIDYNFIINSKYLQIKNYVQPNLRIIK